MGSPEPEREAICRERRDRGRPHGQMGLGGAIMRLEGEEQIE